MILERVWGLNGINSAVVSIAIERCLHYVTTKGVILTTNNAENMHAKTGPQQFIQT